MIPHAVLQYIYHLFLFCQRQNTHGLKRIWALGRDQLITVSFYIKENKKASRRVPGIREGMLCLHLLLRLETGAVGCVGLYIKLQLL